MPEMICQGGARIRSVHLGCPACWGGLQVMLGLRSKESLATIPPLPTIKSNQIVAALLPPGKGEPRKIPNRRKLDDKPVRPQVEDIRSAFIRLLTEKLDLLDVVDSHWGTYQLFRFRTATGRLICVIESYIANNAMYIIDGESPSWLQAAKTDKQNIKKRQEFIACVRHSGEWQRRAMNYLE